MDYNRAANFNRPLINPQARSILKLKKETKIWCVVPAAGIGSRMGGAIPKQYLQLLGKTVLQTTLETLLRVHKLSGIAIGIASNDRWWADTRNALPENADPAIMQFSGGPQRANTVLNGMLFLQENHGARGDDWVLVHDAVRPCVTEDDINTLLDCCLGKNMGGILACESTDTIKRVDNDKRVVQTERRTSLWRALTPQMFPLGLLQQALVTMADRAMEATDESMAMELMGYQPLIVPGSPGNIKITRPLDLLFANVILTG